MKTQTMFSIGVVTIVLVAALHILSSKESSVEKKPQSSRIVSAPFYLPGASVHEFRDSAGRICVIVISNSSELDCGYPIDYNKPPISLESLKPE